MKLVVKQEGVQKMIPCTSLIVDGLWEAER